jgi:transposase
MLDLPSLVLRKPNNPPNSRMRTRGGRGIKARRGPKKAIMAVVASMLTAIYHMLKDGTMYHDLGCDHFKRHSTDQQKKRLVKRLSELGFAVELKPLAA